MVKAWVITFLAAWTCTASAQTDSTGLLAIHPFDHLELWLVNAGNNFNHTYLTLEQALDEGTAIIHNENSQTLWIENRSDTDLFLQSGDLIKGGQQDRMIAEDRILPGHDTATDLEVYCIEQGRSTQRGSEPLATFSASHWMAPLAHTRLITRHALTEQLLTPQLGGLTAPDSSQLALLNSLGGTMTQTFGSVDAAQESVWNDVAVVQSALTKNLRDSITKNASPTSLELTLESSVLADRERSFEHHFGSMAQSQPHSVGVVYAIDGKITSAEIYGTHELFLAMWPKLLRSIAAAVIASPGTTPDAIPSHQDIEHFLQASGTVNTHQTVNARTRVEASKTDSATRFTTWDSKFSHGPVHTEWIAE